MRLSNMKIAAKSDDGWYLLPYQRNIGFPAIICAHIKAGISLAKSDARNSILVFSGGQTRRDVGYVTSIFACMLVYMYICMCECIFIHSFIHTYIHTCVHAYMHRTVETNNYHHFYLHDAMSLHISKIIQLSIFIHIYIHTYIHTYIPSISPLSEAASYYYLASENKWIEPKSNMVNNIYLEEYARDSFENLLFSICRFREVLLHSLID